MQPASEGDAATHPGRDHLTAIEHAYELAIFQICDDGGLYTELSADEVRRLLRGKISAEVTRTGSHDPEMLKAAALTVIYRAVAGASDITARACSHPQLEEGHGAPA